MVSNAIDDDDMGTNASGLTEAAYWLNYIPSDQSGPSHWGVMDRGEVLISFETTQRQHEWLLGGGIISISRIGRRGKDTAD